MSEQAAQIAEIEALLGTAPKPKPSIVKAAKGAGEMGEIVAKKAGLQPTPVPVPEPAAVPEGFPDVEAEPGVKAAREALDKIADKIAANAAEQREAESALGLRANPSEQEIDAVQTQLLLDDSDESTVESLRRLRKRAALLAKVADEARAALKSAIELATRMLTQEAWNAEFRPAARVTALALLQLVECCVAEQNARARLRAGGFAQPNGTLTAIGMIDPLDNIEIRHLIREGHLTREEVLAALPQMRL